MEVSATMVKQLRERTGAGIMDCKKVLVECKGDQEKAVELLRKLGAEKADARSGRVATEGLIVCAVSDSRDIGALVEVNSETDFVSRGEVFRAFSLPLAKLALGIGEDCEDLERLKALIFDESGQTVEEARMEMLLKISENITIRRMTVLKAKSGSKIGSYVHRERLGVLTETTNSEEYGLQDKFAVHVAVMKPQWVDRNAIPVDVLDREREIFLAQAKETGKPDSILEKIVDGKIDKFVKENTMINQPFYDDEEKTVGEIIKASGMEISRFAMMELGK